MYDLIDTQYCQHTKPAKHDRPEKAAYYFSTKSLEYKEGDEYEYDDTEHQLAAGYKICFQALDHTEALYGR